MAHGKGKVKFIRVKGRVVPLRSNAPGGGGGKRKRLRKELRTAKKGIKKGRKLAQKGASSASRFKAAGFASLGALGLGIITRKKKLVLGGLAGIFAAGAGERSAIKKRRKGIRKTLESGFRAIDIKAKLKGRRR